MKARGRNFEAGGGSWVNRLGLLCPLLVLLMGAAAGPAQAQEAPRHVPPPPPTHEQERLLHEHKASRDSLVVEIRKYSRMISALRDSLSLAELGLGIELDDQDKAKLEKTIQEFTLLIEEIGSELGQLDLQIANNRISLLDPQGEGIVINIPENIDEQLSQGLNVLTTLILSELPDSVKARPGGNISGWKGLSLESFKHQTEKRKIIQGNLIKVGDPLEVTRREDVRGNVVVVLGDVEVSGRVDGNVVVVFGNLQVTGTAEVTGEVVVVGGRLDQDPDARVADVTVVDPWRSLGSDGPENLFNPGPMNFLLGQGEFLTMLLFAVAAFVLAPKRRLESAVATLTGRPLPAVGVGVVSSLLLHTLTLVVMAILVLTVIGIPVALLVAVGLVVVGIMSVGLSALVLGRAICRRVSDGCAATWLAVLVGLVALHAVSFLGELLGLVGGLKAPSTLLILLGLSIKACAYFFGLGALTLSRFGSARVAPPAGDQV